MYNDNKVSFYFSTYITGQKPTAVHICRQRHAHSERETQTELNVGSQTQDFPSREISKFISMPFASGHRLPTLKPVLDLCTVICFSTKTTQTYDIPLATWWKKDASQQKEKKEADFGLVCLVGELMTKCSQECNDIPRYKASEIGSTPHRNWDKKNLPILGIQAIITTLFFPHHNYEHQSCLFKAIFCGGFHWRSTETLHS